MFWRNFFLFMVLQIIIDGFMIKFFFPNVIWHFVKDFLLVLTFIFFVLGEPVKNALNSFGNRVGIGVVMTMSALFLVGLAQVFNPLSPGLVRGLLGLKLMFLPWLIIPMAYVYAENFEAIEKFAKTTVICSIPASIFGIIQYIKGPSYMVATFGPGFEATSIVAMISGFSEKESFFRVIGTFATSALYAQFLAANIMLCFGLIFSKSRPRYLWLAALFLSFFVLLTTGSRAGFIMLLSMVGAFALLLKKGRPMIIGFLLLGFGFYMGISVLNPAMGKRYASAFETENFKGRTYGTTSQEFPLLLGKYPMGKGIGAASQASRYLGKVQGQFNLIENYTSKLQLELGIMGVLIFYLFAGILFFRWRGWLKQCEDIYDERIRVFAAIFTAHILGIFVSGAFPESTANYIFVWSFIGFMARIATQAEIDGWRQEDAAQEPSRY